MGWIPDNSYKRNSNSTDDNFKFFKKKKKGVGDLGKRFDNPHKSLVSFKRKGLT